MCVQSPPLTMSTQLKTRLLDVSAQGILVGVPVYNAQAAVRSALAMRVGVARACMAVSVAYAKKHAKAHAEVLPIIDQLVREAPHVSHCNLSRGRLEPLHWCMTEPVRPPNWDVQLYGDYSLGVYWR